VHREIGDGKLSSRGSKTPILTGSPDAKRRLFAPAPIVEAIRLHHGGKDADREPGLLAAAGRA
jgi:hypothetical protein